MSEPTNPPEDSLDLYTQYPYGDLPEPADPLQFNRPAVNFAPKSQPKQSLTPNQSSGSKLKKHRGNPIATVLLPITIVALILGLIYFGTRPEKVVDVTNSPTPTQTRGPATPKSPGLPTTNEFNHDNLVGTFTVSSAEWNGDQLVAHVEIKISKGNLNYLFRAMDKQSGDITECNDSINNNQICTGELRAGEHISGFVTFNKTHGPTQIVLADIRTATHLTIIMVPA